MFSTLFSTQRRLRKAEIPALAMITPSPWRQAWRSLKRNRLAMFCLLLLAVMAAWCVLGPLWSPWKDDATDVLMINKPPGAEHWLGTDFLGRDVYTRLLMAGRISLIIGLLTMLLSVALGYLLGAVSGYAGGLTDKLIMRLADLVMTIPGLPLLIVAGAMLSELDFSPDARIYGGGDAQPAGVAKAGAAGAGSMPVAARARLHAGNPGAGPLRPPSPVWPSAAQYHSDSGGHGHHGGGECHSQRIGAQLPWTGVVPPTPSWGNMMDAANSLIDFQRRPWLWMPPGIAIFITVIAINVLGDGLRDAMDPKMKQRLK
jgi:peptide/nickel transport system permease protein